MLSRYYSLVYPDKTLNHPILGKISCSNLCQKYTQCLQQSNPALKHHDVCLQIEITCKQCFKAANNDQFTLWINKQFEQAQKLIKYLRSRGNTIPDKLFLNNYAIFTNPDNLIKMKQIRRQMKNLSYLQ